MANVPINIKGCNNLNKSSYLIYHIINLLYCFTSITVVSRSSTQ